MSPTGLFLIFILLFIPLSFFLTWSLDCFQSSTTFSSKNDERVPITLYAMSQCPDAVVCEDLFRKVLRKVNHITKLQIDYIGRFAEDKREQDPSTLRVICKHGEQECFGNILELCSQHVFPAPIYQRRFLEFLYCLNRDISQKGTHDYTRKCAEYIGLDYTPIAACANDSTLGPLLLIESVKRTQAANVTKSCTIFINGKQRCIRDGGWYECPDGYGVDDFVRIIKEVHGLYEA
ncbi:hypothetical protein G9A89_014470 [Geosiphon pyriformis]|nr:hypothetical protein G9A89_014470 [Geosiphon pyriformis]